MKKLAGILVLLLFIPVSVDSQQPILIIELSSDGEAKVTQILAARSIISSVSVPLVSDRISNVLATDERGILLKTTQTGYSLGIATLGATGVGLSYKADITSYDSGVWNISYSAETETVVLLPPLSTIVSVSSIPIDIEDNAVEMPPGDISITYTISKVSAKTFFVLEGGQNYPVEITSASKIDDFFKQSNEIRFGISSSATLLVVVPSTVLPNPIDASLNGEEVSFNPYYNNGTHNWIRIDPHEAGVIEIGGDVRASQIISDNPMTNEGSGENDSIFLTIGIILGVLAVGYVVFRKYFKIGLVRTSSSQGSNRSVKSSKHVKKNMKGRHVGIFALALLPLLLTVPSAFADEHDDPALVFSLLSSITDGQTDLANLEVLIEDNNFTVDLDKAKAQYGDAVGLVAIGEYAEAQKVLDKAEMTHDEIYDQIYVKIEEQQDARFNEYVESAKFSLTFLIENGPALGLTAPTIAQLATTLQVLEYGTNSQIEAATGGNSQIGITLSVLPKDLSLPSSFTTGSGLGEELKSKLPPGIAKKYDYSLDSKTNGEKGPKGDKGPEGDLGLEGFEGAAGDKELGDLPPGYEMKLLDADGILIKDFEDNNLPKGFLTKFDGVRGFLDDGTVSDDLPGGFAKKLAVGELPKGFVKKFDGISEIFGFTSYGDVWWSESEDAIFDDSDKVKKVKKVKKLKKDKKTKTNEGSGGSGDDKCPPGQAKKGNC